jgi:hypothetical protein
VGSRRKNLLSYGMFLSTAKFVFIAGPGVLTAVVMKISVFSDIMLIICGREIEVSGEHVALIFRVKE